MFSKLFSVLALILAVSAVLQLVDAKKPKWHELEGYTFDRYIADFAKAYGPTNAEEFAKRKALFDAELKEVRTHNEDKTQTWKKGVNAFSDWTADEKRQRLFGFDMSLKQRYGSKPVRRHSTTSGNNKLDSSRNLPAFVDWRNAVPSVLTAVKNQGQCGSCWAHAATETIETAWAQASGQLFVLSQQQIASCTPNPMECGGTGGCGGGIAELAIDYISEVGGINQEWSYSYKSFFGTNYPCSFWKNLSVVKTTGYVSVAHNDAGAVMHALATAGPLAVSVMASTWSNYESGIFSASGCPYSKNITMDHAVQLVGYGYDDGLDMPFFLVRNSWGMWGEDGYIRLERSKDGAEKCGWNVNPQQGSGCKGQTAPQWACGTCGIAFDTLYALADYNAN